MIYEVNDLTFAYKEQTRLLEHVSLTLEEGEIMTILGRNGTGKSTLMACLQGMLTPSSGEIRLCDAPLGSLSERQIAKAVGFVPQAEHSVFSFSVLDYVMMGCACDLGLFARPGKKERSAAEAALEELGILHLKDRPFPRLSGGEQQQCTIARAIVRHPKAVLLDEPTAHLDVPNRVKVLRMVKALSQKGYAVMFTTHDPDHALMLGGSALLFTGEGSVITGKVFEILTVERLRPVYGNELCLTRVEELNRTACICSGL